MVRYRQIQARPQGNTVTFSDVDRSGAEKILRGASASGRTVLSAEEVYAILEAYRIPVAPWRIAATIEDAVAAAAALGYPVVVKADAAGIVHKSDMGGVAVNLADAGAVESAAADMKARFSDADLKFFVQKFIAGGTEIIAGAKAEEGLGHLIMFGMGGIYVEILKDVVFKLTPLTDTEAEAMIDCVRMAPLLRGARGRQGVDREKLKEVILRLNQMVTDLPAIAELDLNPTLAFADTVLAVDARISL
jgi:acetyltransferase